MKSIASISEFSETIIPSVTASEQEEKTPAQQPQQQECSFDEYNV